MDSGKAGEQEFKEPKRKKKTPGVIPNNPFPIIFWKKLGIPPCSDLWPCYNGLYDGEGVVFPSSEDISDIHSMGYFGRNAFEDRSRDSSVKGIPVVRERQWRMMVKWATDFGYVITEQDGSEDGRKENAGSTEKEDEKGESTSKTRSMKGGNEDGEGFDLEENGKAVESNLIDIDEEDVISTSNESVKVSELSDIVKSGNQQISSVEMKDSSITEEENEDGNLTVEGCQNEARLEEVDKSKENSERKECMDKSGREEDQERRMLKEGDSKAFKEEENDEKEDEMVEVLEEVYSEENLKTNKTIKEVDSILNSGKSENASKSDIEEVVVKDEVSIISCPVNLEKRTFVLDTKTDAEGLVYVKGSQEKGKIQNIDDFVEIIEEKSGSEALENIIKNNGESVKKSILKRSLEGELCNVREKRNKKNVWKCEGNVILSRSSEEGKALNDTDERKCSDEILNSSGECEIVEINDRNSCRNEGRGEKRQNSETDDDIIVVSVDDGESSLDYGPNSCKRFTDKLAKDMGLPLGKRQNLAMKNVAGKKSHNKYKYTKKNDDSIEIDLHGKEMLKGEEDTSKCNDVEELYQKRNDLRDCDDKTMDEKGSTVSSSKSDIEVSPCIVIPDSDSEDDTERGPQWESDPSLFLPSLEWLKLFPEEAFFLAYGLGCVQVWDGRKTEDENEIIQIKEKKQLKQHDYPEVVDSKPKKENSRAAACFPTNLKSSDDALLMVPCSDKTKDSKSALTSSVLSNGETASCDKEVNDKKENTLSDETERNVVTTGVVNGNHRLSPEKPKEKRTCTLSVTEEKCCSDSSDKNSSITVIDLVDSPPSHKHFMDKESSGNDDVEPVFSKQMPESIFNFHHKPMSLEELWNAFRLSRSSQSSVPFETSYAVYHHFRSKGWVVKPGIRFGGDFLLYKDGPSFYHASYLVVIDSSLPHENSSITWNTLAGLNRLAENVAKELMICRVEWPESMMESQLCSPKCLHGLTVEEILVKRWVSMKERDADEDVSDDDKNCDFIPLARRRNLLTF